MKARTFLIGVGVFIVGAYIYVLNVPPHGQRTINASGADTSDKVKQAVWLEKGKDAVRHRLKDPGSAQFREVFFNRDREGTPVACGQVNAKNSFGGYTGYERFISAGRTELTFLESDVKDFENAWRKFCR